MTGEVNRSNSSMFRQGLNSGSGSGSGSGTGSGSGVHNDGYQHPEKVVVPVKKSSIFGQSSASSVPKPSPSVSIFVHNNNSNNNNSNSNSGGGSDINKIRRIPVPQIYSKSEKPVEPVVKKANGDSSLEKKGLPLPVTNGVHIHSKQKLDDSKKKKEVETKDSTVKEKEEEQGERIGKKEKSNLVKTSSPTLENSNTSEKKAIDSIEGNLSPVNTSANIKKKETIDQAVKVSTENSDIQVSDLSNMDTKINDSLLQDKFDKKIDHESDDLTRINSSEQNADAEIVKKEEKEEKEQDIADSEYETDTAETLPMPSHKGRRLIRKLEYDNRLQKLKSKSHNNSEEEDYLNKDEGLNLKKRKKSFDSEGQNVSRSVSPSFQNKRKISKTIKDALGRTRLQKCCIKGKYEEAKQLIQDGANVNVTDHAGNTPLHEAALNGHFNIAKLLVQNGAKVNIQSGPDDLDTPLIDACSHCHLDIVKLLLANDADPRFVNTMGQTALDSVDEDEEDAQEIIRLLKDAHKKFESNDNSNSNYRKAPLTHNNSSRSDATWIDLTTREGRDEIYHRAADGDDAFIGNYLANGGKPHPKALTLAAKHGHSSVVSLLLAFGANIEKADENGETALFQTVGRGHFETVQLLLNNGANPKKVNTNGISVLDKAKDPSSVNDPKEIALLEKAIEDYKSSGKPEVNDERRNFEEKKTKRKRSKHKENVNNSSYDLNDDYDEEKEFKKERKLKRKLELEREAEELMNSDHRTGRRQEISHKRHDEDEEIRKKKKRDKEKKLRDSNGIEKESHSLKDRNEEFKSKASAKGESNSSSKEPEPVTSETSLRQRTHTPPVAQVTLTPEEIEAKKAKERELEKQRQLYEQQRKARRQVRAAEILSSIEEDKKRREQELKKLELLEQERAKIAKEKAEEKAKLIEERKKIELQKEEISQRLFIREQYPYGLKIAKFNEERSIEDALLYLPLYVVENHDEKLVTDLQVILLLGIENFYDKYQNLTKTPVTNPDKTKLWNFYFPIIGYDRSKQYSNHDFEKIRQEGLSKFLSLDVNWIRLAEVEKIINKDFKLITKAIEIKGYCEIEFLHVPVVSNTLTNGSTTNSYSNNSHVQTNSASQIYHDELQTEREIINENIPRKFRNRDSVLRAINAAEKGLW